MAVPDNETKVNVNVNTKKRRQRRRGPKKARRRPPGRQVALRGRPRRGQGRGSNLNMARGSRMLLSSTVPKAYFKTSGDNRKMMIVGSEVIGEVLTSQFPSVVTFQLNPALSPTFPKLSGFASQFERYKFHSVQLCYSTASPATRSGAIGLCLFTEHKDASYQVPTFVPEFGSYQFSTVGTIAASMCTPVWTNRDPEYFFIPGNGESDVQVDPLKVFQGTAAVLLRDSVEADSEALAGYISLVYKVELINMRPSIDKMVLTGYDSASSPAQRMIESSDSLGGLVDLGPVRTQQGQWNRQSLNKVFDGYTEAKKIYADVAAGVKYLFGITGTTSAVITPSSKFVERKSPQSAFVDVQVDSYYYNPRFCPDYADLKTVEKKLVPMAAGDLAVNLLAKTSKQVGFSTVAQKIISAGTTLQPIEFAVDVLFPPAPEGETWGACWTVSPFGATGEERDFYLYSANVSVE